MFDAKSYLTGKGRTITKDESLEIIDRAEREGLVLQPGNSLQPFLSAFVAGVAVGADLRKEIR